MVFSQETKAIPVSGFFLTTSLPATLNRAWKFNVHMQKQSRQHPVFPQQGSHFSCRDLFSFAPSFKHLLLSKSCSGGATQTAHKHLPHFQRVYTFTSHKSENISSFLLFLFKSLENNINPSFLFWRSQQHSLSLLVPSAAIKRCRVSECDQLLCRGSAVVLETIQRSHTSLQSLPGLLSQGGSRQWH